MYTSHIGLRCFTWKVITQLKTFFAPVEFDIDDLAGGKRLQILTKIHRRAVIQFICGHFAVAGSS